MPLKQDILSALGNGCAVCLIFDVGTGDETLQGH
jgi:hypothetical protein